jgi:hypothetical protein
MLPEVLSHALLVFVCAAISFFATVVILLTEGDISDIQIGIVIGPMTYSYLFLGTSIYDLVAATLAAAVVLKLLAWGAALRSFASMFRLSLLATGFATLGIIYGVLTDLPLLTGEIAAYVLLLSISMLLRACASDEREQQHDNEPDGEAQNVPQAQPHGLWPPEYETGEGQFSSEWEG